jgi:hypothetical protein
MDLARSQVKLAVTAARWVVIERQFEIENLVGDGVDEDDGVALAFVGGDDAELAGGSMELETAQRAGALLGIQMPGPAATTTEDLDRSAADQLIAAIVNDTTDRAGADGRINGARGAFAVVMRGVGAADLHQHKHRNTEARESF